MKDGFTVDVEYTQKCQIQARIFGALPALLPEREPARLTCVVMGHGAISNAETPIRPGVHRGLEGSRAKRHAAPQTATAGHSTESMQKKGQVTKLAFKISLAWLILLLLPNYNRFHNPAKSRVTIHIR